MVINELPVELEPLVQPIDTWFRSRRLASVFEARVGPGRLLVSTMDVTTDLEQRPSARQFRQSMMGYVGSSAFNPQVSVDLDDVRALFRGLSAIEQTGVRRISALTQESNYESALAIDGDTNSMWHSRWSGDGSRYPHEITLELDEPTDLHGIRYLARQDGNGNGKIGDYEVLLSTDGTQWTPVASGRFTGQNGWQNVLFADGIPASFVRLRALSALNSGPHAAIAELDLILGAGAMDN